MRESMPTRFDVRDVNKVLEKAGFEKKDPVYDDGRIIVEEGHLGLKVESICSTMKHLAREVEVKLQHEGRRLDAACALYLPLTEYKSSNPITHHLCQLTLLEIKEISQERKCSNV